MTKTGGDGIGETHPNVNHHIGTLNLLLDLRIAGGSGIGSGEAGMSFIQHAFA